MITAIPSEQNMSSYEVIESGDSPRKIFICYFWYEDGTIRSFDGKEWKVVAIPDSIF